MHLTPVTSSSSALLGRGPSNDRALRTEKLTTDSFVSCCSRPNTDNGSTLPCTACTAMSWESLRYHCIPVSTRVNRLLNVRGLLQRIKVQSQVQTCSVSDTRCTTAAAAAVGTPATCTSRYVPAGTPWGSPALPAASASALALREDGIVSTSALAPLNPSRGSNCPSSGL